MSDGHGDDTHYHDQDHSSLVLPASGEHSKNGGRGVLTALFTDYTPPNPGVGRAGHSLLVYSLLLLHRTLLTHSSRRAAGPLRDLHLDLDMIRTAERVPLTFTSLQDRHKVHSRGRA